MKKLLSVLLCLTMLMSVVTIGAGAEESGMTGEQTSSTSGTSSIEPIDVETLEKFGFMLDEDSYDTDDLKPGSHVLDPRYSYFVDLPEQVKKVEVEKVFKTHTDDSYLFSYDESASEKVAAHDKDNSKFFTSTAFSPTGNGVDDHIARVYFNDNEKAGAIMICVYDAKGNMTMEPIYTGGYIETSSDTPLVMWGFEGTLSVTGGDFDGDGMDELAVYTPNNDDETKDGSTPASITITIFDGDGTGWIVKSQVLNIAEDASEWQYSCDNGVKKYYSIPQVSLCAEDVNGDGIDDLMAAVSFSTWFRGTEDTRSYNTATLLSHNSHFASVLEVFEGRSGDNHPLDYLDWAVKHKVLVTNDIDGSRYILRDANITVGDVTGEGSKEIIIAGNYTKAKYYKATSMNALAATAVDNRRLNTGGEEGALSTIVGFATYDTIKTKHPANDGGYTWTVRKEGWGPGYWYIEDKTDPYAGTKTLCAYQHEGFGYPDMVFVGGQYFKYSPDDGKLVYQTDHSSSVSDLGKNSVCWLGKAVAGNVTDDMFGREMLAFPFYYKTSGEDIWNCRRINRAEAWYSDGEVGATNNYAYALKNVTTQQVVSLVMVDDTGKSSYITYSGDDTDIYYSDVDVLSIIQAPPVYEELTDGIHIGGSSTSFSKSTGSSEAETLGSNLTAGVILGFQQEFSLLGAVRVGGIDIEAKLTSSKITEETDEVSYNYSAGFTTSGTSDAVTIFTVPYVRYNCSMYVPQYTIPTQGQYNEMCSFYRELDTNLKNFVQNGTTGSGKYLNGCKYYEFKYASKVTESNYHDQINVLMNVAEEIDLIEKAVKNFEGSNGIYDFGQVVEGETMPYHYNVPQTPVVTTVDAKTYDAIAATIPHMQPVYGNVFDSNYRPGDPTTYPSYVEDLNNVGTVLSAKTNLGTSGDGFLSNTAITGENVTQTQTISVEESESTLIGWGITGEGSVVGDVYGVKFGATLSNETNGSTVKTSTKGTEYSGTVAGLPANTPNGYSYDWKMVAYTSTINGSKVPVVGYLVKLPNNITPPPSVPQNIQVANVTDSSITLTWEDGNRPADRYELSRIIYNADNSERIISIDEEITSVDGKCSYTIEDLASGTTSYYIIDAYEESTKSVSSKIITVTTLPEGFAAVMEVDGFDDNLIYGYGTTLDMTATLTANKKYDTFYQWQINEGNGWTDISKASKKAYQFTTPETDGTTMFRCVAMVVAENGHSYDIPSNPVTARYGDFENGYGVRVDEKDKDIFAKCPKNFDKSVRVSIEKQIGDAYYYESVVLNPETSGNTVAFGLSDVIDANGTVKVFFWDEETMQPLTHPFVR